MVERDLVRGLPSPFLGLFRYDLYGPAPMGEVAEFALLYDIELTNDVVLFAGDTGLATTFVAGAVITSASVSTLPGFSNIAARFLTEKDILKAVYSQLEFSAKYIGFNAVRSVLELKGDDSFVKVTVL